MRQGSAVGRAYRLRHSTPSSRPPSSHTLRRPFRACRRRMSRRALAVVHICQKLANGSTMLPAPLYMSPLFFELHCAVFSGFKGVMIRNPISMPLQVSTAPMHASLHASSYTTTTTFTQHPYGQGHTGAAVRCSRGASLRAHLLNVKFCYV